MNSWLQVGDYVPNAFHDFAEALSNPIKHQSEVEKRAKQLELLADDADHPDDNTEDSQINSDEAPPLSPTADAAR